MLSSLVLLPAVFALAGRRGTVLDVAAPAEAERRLAA
jgi:hypothetical protein